MGHVACACPRFRGKSLGTCLGDSSSAGRFWGGAGFAVRRRMTHLEHAKQATRARFHQAGSALRSGALFALCAACSAEFPEELTSSDEAAAFSPPVQAGFNCPLNNCFRVTNTSSSGPGSFDQAILDANATAGFDHIVFDIPGAAPHVISGLDAWVTDSVAIDGYTQPDAVRATANTAAAPTIVLEPTAIGQLALQMDTDGSSVEGLVIQGYRWGAIVISGDDNSVRGCFLGTDATGTVPVGNGVGVTASGARNVIGGTSAEHRNVIGGNTVDGVFLAECVDCLVIGNSIGTDTFGTVHLGNGSYSATDAGIHVYDGGGNVIGGTTLGSANVISGNMIGVHLESSDNAVLGNFIGTDPTGTLGTNALANVTGVVVGRDAQQNLIGDSTAGAGNVISNQYFGAGLQILGDANIVKGNKIGTDVAGTAAIPNDYGVVVLSASFNQIGGTAPGAGNVISGNQYQGLELAPYFGVGGPKANLVRGNIIGLDATGNSVLPNGSEGIWILEGSLNVVGGVTADAANIVSGNGGDGILIESTDGKVTGVANVVAGNRIGVDASGVVSHGNNGSGVHVVGGSANWVGGAVTGSGNVIAFNGGDGVSIDSGWGHAVLENVLHDNADLNLDLGPTGRTPNDGLGDLDTGANDLQNFPVIKTIAKPLGFASVDWEVQARANASLRLEFFASSGPCTFSRGRADRFLLSIDAVANAAGVATGSTKLATLVAAGERVTMTASEIVGPVGRNTSELSNCVLVP